MTIDKMIQSLVGRVEYGAVVGLEGSTWAETPGFMPIESELKGLLNIFDIPVLQLQKGIQFQKEHFMVVHQEPNTIVAQNSAGLLVLCQCKICVIITYVEAGFHREEGCIIATKELAGLIDNTPIKSL